jgi:hypothetical protein
VKITTAQFLQLLRRRIGNPSVKELGDEMLTDAAAYALRDYSLVKPRNRQQIVIQLLPGMETYTMDPAPEIVIDVVPSGPMNQSGRMLGNEFRATNIDVVSFNLPDFETYFQHVSSYRELFEQIEWNYDNPPDVYISPSPAYNMQAIVVVGEIHTIDTVSDKDEEPILLGASAFAQEMWANQRDSLTVMEAPTAQGTVRLESGDRLRNLSKDNMSRFRDRIGWNRPYIGQG